MSTPVVFGDFVALAQRRLAASARMPSSITPGRDVQQTGIGLLRIVSVLRRFTFDLTRTVRQLPDPLLDGLDEWERAALVADDALASAAHALEPFALSEDSYGRRAGAGYIRSLHGAAAALSAGRDLLQGHFTTSPSGARLYNSGWALAIASAGGSQALLAEVGQFAGHAAVLASSPRPVALAGLHAAEQDAHLASAGVWLRSCQACIESAVPADLSVASLRRDFLLSVPQNVMLPRITPRGGLSVADLCQAVNRCAARARHSAWIAANSRPHDPTISATSWHQIATASTITSHHVSVLCETLAGHAAANSSMVNDELQRAAERARESRQAWLDLARQVRTVTTDTRGHIGAAGAEVSDLAVWTGRLAYANPDWILADGPAQPVRTARQLAPRATDFPRMIAAAHQTSEAMSSVARSVRHQVRSADLADRIFVLTRSLGEQDGIPRRFTVAPTNRSNSLVAGIDATRSRTDATADVLAEVALTIRAPSHVLGTARHAARSTPDAPNQGAARSTKATRLRDELSSVGQIEAALRDGGTSNSRLLWRAAGLDQAIRQLAADVAGEKSGRRSTLREASDLEAGQ
jgi:hypothetical protein